MNLPEYKSVIERILVNINNIGTLLNSITEESFMTKLKDFNAIYLEFL